MDLMAPHMPNARGGMMGLSVMMIDATPRIGSQLEKSALNLTLLKKCGKWTRFQIKYYQ
jgi:hypothetical protein